MLQGYLNSQAELLQIYTWLRDGENGKDMLYDFFVLSPRAKVLRKEVANMEPYIIEGRRRVRVYVTG